MDRLIESLVEMDDGCTEISFTEIRLEGGGMALDLKVDPCDGTTPRCWSVECSQAFDFKLVRPGAADLALLDDHVLLWPFCQDTASAYFRGSVTDPLRAVGDLHHAHVAATGGWIPFERFFNPVPLPQLLSTEGGKLGEGPINLLDVYRRVLAAHGTNVEVKFSHAPNYPNYWNGEDWVPVSRAEVKVLLLGDSYIIGREFRAISR
jgi:hypothetical protein